MFVSHVLCSQCLILLCIHTYIISNYLECYSFHVEKHRLRSQIDWTQDAWNQEYDMFFSISNLSCIIEPFVKCRYTTLIAILI